MDASLHWAALFSAAATDSNSSVAAAYAASAGLNRIICDCAQLVQVLGKEAEVRDADAKRKRKRRVLLSLCKWTRVAVADRCEGEGGVRAPRMGASQKSLVETVAMPGIARRQPLAMPWHPTPTNQVEEGVAAKRLATGLPLRDSQGTSSLRGKK